MAEPTIRHGDPGGAYYQDDIEILVRSAASADPDERKAAELILAQMARGKKENGSGANEVEKGEGGVRAWIKSVVGF